MSQHIPASTPTARKQGDHPDAIAPDGSEIRVLVDDRHGATRASLCEVRLPAGGISRPVWHQTVEEIWYVLEGWGQVWRSPVDATPDAGEAVLVGPGNALIIPTGWRFQFSAGEDGPLRFLCYTSPPWPGSDEAQPADTGRLGKPTV